MDCNWKGITMDATDITRRLEAQDRLLHAILAALAPPSEDGAGFDDLITTLSDLTMAVADVTDAVRALHWNGCGQSRPLAAPSSVKA